MTLPERLGRLRRVDRIGAGGFATVWLYHDDDLDSPVAVKALADNWAQRADVRERFLEEARMLRRADSDHVVRVYDIGEADQTPYFVMSYADLGSLATLTDVGPVSPERAVELISQAGEGVQVLHQRGIIHRDIKPQNLLLRSSDDDAVRVLVADLGVAKAMLHASGLTQVVGTPAYMAPEQANGLGVDRRADIHALGAVAYHLLSGRYAREGGIAELAAPQLPAPLSSIRPELAPYDDVLLRSMEPRPEDRWPDVPSFVRALRDALASSGPVQVPYDPRSSPDTVYLQRTTWDTPTSVTPVPPGAPSIEPADEGDGPRRGRSRRVWWALAAVLAVLLAGVGVALGVTGALGGNGNGGGNPGGGTPIGSPTTSAPPTTVPDVHWPTLSPTLPLSVRHRLVAPTGSVWSYAVPAGWDPSFLDAAGVTIPAGKAGKIDQQTQIRWRPHGEPAIGGYSLRYRALDPVQSPLMMRIQRTALLRHARYPGFDLYKHTDQAIWFTYVDDVGHVRYNFWRWVPDPDAGGNAGLEISVSGRKQDIAGLDALALNAASAAHIAH